MSQKITPPTERAAGDSRATFAMLTDTGLVRAHNEDACAADESAGLYVVCDGMGGAAAGEVAARMTSRIFLEKARPGLDVPQEWRLQRAVQSANAAVFAEAQRFPEFRGMGTTLVALEVSPEAGAAWTVHVGDSRCYRLRNGVLQALTADHSVVDEQVRLGLLTAEEAANSPLRHVITRAVGSHSEVEGEIQRHATQPGDIFLLCSDGLSGEVGEDAIAGVLRSMGDDLQGGANALVDLANDAGGHDNITVILVRV